MHKAIIAVDFDDTIAHSKYPEILGLKKDAKQYINKLFDEGYYIIVNTCRSGKEQERVVKFLFDNGVKYHQINENHPKLIKIFKEDSRKISCDFYLDDKNIEMALIRIHSTKDECPWRGYYKSITSVVSHKNFTSILNFKK